MLELHKFDAYTIVYEPTARISRRPRHLLSLRRSIRHRCYPLTCAKLVVEHRREQRTESSAAIANLSHFHREHEKFYARAPLEEAETCIASRFLKSNLPSLQT